MNATLVVFKQIQCWAKRCQPVIAKGKKGGDREEEIQESHSIDSAHRFVFHFQFLSGRKRGLLVGQGEWLLPLYNRNKEP